MSDNAPKDESFFRKVVRFVANPATDWADLNSRQPDGAELDLEKSELKAMIERKKRNDFVRKREFDMLRKVRREGLSPEQLAALGGSSKIDSESKADLNAQRPADSGVKAKIDEIEQQMVGDGFSSSSSRRPGDIPPTQPAPFRQTSTRPAVMSRDASAQTTAMPSAVQPRTSTRMPLQAEPASHAAPAPSGRSAEAQSVSLGGLHGSGADMSSPFTVEVSEVVHDPELDEAVIAFANADFEQCEQALTALTHGGSRAEHAETWLVLFDLYRATGQQHKFEGLALEYAQQFGWSAPQWFSLPKLVAEAAQSDKPRTQRVAAGEIGWICPETLDTEAVARLRSVTLQLPLPWVFDWSALRSIDPEAATHLSELFRQWSTEVLDMRWLSGERFLGVLADGTPTGVKDVDPAFWVLRLDALRLANRPDAFDEAAIDYCVTYEVSPPSWERAKCQVRIGGSGLSTQSPPLSQVSEVATSYVESTIEDQPGANHVQVAAVDLSGQLVGDISATLTPLDGQLGSAALVTVSCQRLIRVDFVAAGDLLNWVLAKRGENRSVTFADAHRLVALFFGAMGINENASVRVRNI
ncbi:MAG TPA: STAS domain-containing protein [Burkholderiaceae bacterium]|jgi:hypothetical protein|nr:STAS domain-containing protein [Burkholderiaceae bacterium]